ncbi:MAG: PAS domain S-box protein, partial [Candidatus Aenigmarchaeota archaeon]|nr:PAS domain S-box protein [Candidatus Aenigmarchaeota archaeon]
MKRKESEGNESPDELYKVLLEHSLQGIVVIQDFRIVFANKNFAKISGYTIKEMLSLSREKVKEMVHPEDQSLVWGRLRDRLAWKKIPPHYEYRGIRKNGSVCFLEMFASRITYRGKPAIIGTIIDITEQKKTERAIRESEGKYRNLVEMAPYGIVSVDLKGVVKSCNAAFVKIIGYSKNEIIGKNFTNLPTLRKRDIPQYLKLFTDIMRGKIPEPFESEWKIKDGSFRDAEIRIGLTKSGGKLTGMQAFIMDITERKNAQEVVKTERDRAQKYLDISGVMFLALDKDGNVTLINREGCNILGYKQSEIIGQKWFDKFLPDAIKVQVKGVFVDIIAGKESAQGYYENYVKTKSGEKKLIAWHNTLLKDENGNATGTLSSGEDITERNKATDELQKLSSIIQYSTELVNMATLDGKMIFLNEAGRKFLGINPKEVEKYKILDVIPAEYVNKVKSEVLPSIIKRGGWEGDLAYKNVKTGKLTHFHSITFSIKDPRTGKPLYLANVSRDITEQIKIQTEIKRSEEKFRTLYSSLREGVALHEVVYNKKGAATNYIITSVNPAYEKITGLKAKDAVGKKASELYGTGKPPYMDIFVKVAKTRKPETFETYFAPIKKHFKISVVSPAKGQFATVFDDITERITSDEISHKQRDLGLKLSSADNLKDAMSTVLDFVTYLPDVDSGGIYILNKKIDSLNLVVHEGLSKEFLNATSHYDSNSSHMKLVMVGKPTYVNYPKFVPDEKDPIKMKEGLRALGVIPILHEDGVIGALNIASHKKDEFTESTRDVLETTAAQIGGVISRMRAEEELKKSKKNLETKVDELERFSKVGVGRELKMVELKKRIRELEKQS